VDIEPAGATASGAAPDRSDRLRNGRSPMVI
jgi:hypothetical protein